MSRRVLVVTSSYAPAMIADMHRARHLAWELPGQGWEVEVLAPDLSMQHPSCIEADAAAFFPPHSRAHYAREWLAPLFRTAGSRSIGWRALAPLFVAGMRLLRQMRFDAIYISTTQFPLFLLGPAWRALTGVPYVIDLHDPCFKDDALQPWAHRGLKHSTSRWIAKRIESLCVARASGLVCVSPHYVEALLARYASPPWMAEGRHAVIPFPAARRDLAQATPGPPATGRCRIGYVGAGGPVMQRAFERLCGTLARLRASDPAALRGATFALRGTTFGWSPGDPRFLHELARGHGVEDLIDENPERVSYRASLQHAESADGLLILGVDDRGYMPSKLFGYAMTGKPLLAVVRSDGCAMAFFRGPDALGHAIGFGGADDPDRDVEALVRFIGEVRSGTRFDREAALRAFSASAMSARHAALFEACRTR